MFMVWIISNLKKKESKSLRANKILAKVDESFALVTLKLNPFYCFSYFKVVAVLSFASAAYACPLRCSQDDSKHLHKYRHYS